jgi:hypothetical protein
MTSTAARLCLVLVTLAFVCAVALTVVIVTKPHGGLTGGVSTGVVPGWSILRVGGKMHLDDVALGFVSRKAGTGPLDY